MVFPFASKVCSGERLSGALMSSSWNVKCLQHAGCEWLGWQLLPNMLSIGTWVELESCSQKGKNRAEVPVTKTCYTLR